MKVTYEIPIANNKPILFTSFGNTEENAFENVEKKFEVEDLYNYLEIEKIELRYKDNKKTLEVLYKIPTKEKSLFFKGVGSTEEEAFNNMVNKIKFEDIKDYIKIKDIELSKEENKEILESERDDMLEMEALERRYSRC